MLEATNSICCKQDSWREIEGVVVQHTQVFVVVVVDYVFLSAGAVSLLGFCCFTRF